jgi:hypothetical protein
MNKPECCIFCLEDESSDHLFFKCILAKQVWHIISEFFSLPLGDDYISIAQFWVANKKYAVVQFVQPLRGAFGNSGMI